MAPKLAGYFYVSTLGRALDCSVQIIDFRKFSTIDIFMQITMRFTFLYIYSHQKTDVWRDISHRDFMQTKPIWQPSRARPLSFVHIYILICFRWNKSKSRLYIHLELYSHFLFFSGLFLPLWWWGPDCWILTTKRNFPDLKTENENQGWPFFSF